MPAREVARHTPGNEANSLQRLLLDDALKIVKRGVDKEDKPVA
jgi:hypothetical protein